MPRLGADVNGLSKRLPPRKAGRIRRLEDPMSDPLNPWEEKDRMKPTGDLSAHPETGVMTVQGDGADTAVDDTNPAPDANDLEADNAVEADTIETLDPENPPA
jgi:hypothetical protein